MSCKSKPLSTLLCLAYVSQYYLCVTRPRWYTELLRVLFHRCEAYRLRGFTWILPEAEPRHRYEGRGTVRRERQDSRRAVRYKAGYGSCPLEAPGSLDGQLRHSSPEGEDAGVFIPGFPGPLLLLPAALEA